MTKIRLGAVFYGGISLAVYMSGIANELLNLVRSTQDGVTLSPVQQVYKDLAAQIETNYESPVQFSIDAISGTSAGGINGVFLAYALNNGGSLDALTDIWAKEGDFNAILNTEFSRINAPFARPSGLLNGNRFYVKIFESLCQLDKDSKELDKDGKFTQTPPKPKYPGQPVRLVVTATDLDGGEIPLTTKQNDLNENNHAYSFKFDLNSLIQAKLPMLAFAARVTAGIPGVFESLNLDSALELIKSNANKSDQRYQQFSTSMAKDFCDFFVGLKPPQDIGQRRFVDGGVLDNKPLAHAISALKSEPSTGETHLMYIEPTNSSLHVIDNPKEKSEKPKEPASRPISDATRSVGIRMDEPIRPDLEVAQHLNRVADVIYPEFDQDFLNGLKASSPVNQASQAFHAYSQLRLRQVSRRLASIALTVQGLPVVEALIEEKASLFATHLDVKKEIDTWFVLRKLQFLLRLFKAQKINPLTLKEVQDAYQTQHSAMKNVSSKNILATAHEAEDTNKIPSEALPLDQATVKVWLGRLEFFLVAKVRGVANDLQHFKTHLNDPDIASHWEDCFTNLDMQYFPMLAAIDLDDVLKLEVFRVGTEAATIGQSYLKGIESKKRIQRRDCRSWQGLP